MQGKIMKGIAGFYYVYVVGSGLYECRAKGIFRQQNRKPLVGDDVEIEVIDEEKKTGNLVEIFERKNELIRPAVANIDGALVIFAAAKPDPNFNLLDRFLISMEKQGIPCLLCFNKVDNITEEEEAKIREIYAEAGYEIAFTSVRAIQVLRGERDPKGEVFDTERALKGYEQIREFLKGKTTTVAGPSGVGKSSFINLLQSNVKMETGSLSEKIDRGKNTTRHAELIYIEDGTFIMDTPGFTSFYIDDVEKEDLQSFFPEIAAYEPNCKFAGCSHLNEPKCGVQEALSQGKIHPVRYENYKQMYCELRDKKPVYR